MQVAVAFHASGLAASFGVAYAGITYGVGGVQPMLDLLPAAVSAHIPEGAGTVAVAFLLAECTAPPRCLDPATTHAQLYGLHSG